MSAKTWCSWRLLSGACLALGLVAVFGGGGPPKMMDYWSKNRYMVAGLHSLRHREPVLLRCDREDVQYCPEGFTQEVAARSAREPLTSLSSLQWAALCRWPIALRVSPQSDSPLYSLFAGVVVEFQEGVEEALSVWQQDPSLAWYFAQIAAQLFEEGCLDQALQVRDLALEICAERAASTYAFSRFMCRYYVYEERNMSRAVSGCERAAGLRGYNRDWHILGLVYYRLGRYEDAIAVSREADSVVARYRQALSLEALGEYSTAEELLQDVIAESPDYRPAQVALVGLYLDQDRVCDAQLAAKELFVEACESDVDWLPDAYCDLLARDDLRSCNEH